MYVPKIKKEERNESLTYYEKLELGLLKRLGAS